MKPQAKSFGQLLCSVGSYTLTIDHTESSLKFRAYSEMLGKVFESELTDDAMPNDLKAQFIQCSIIYDLIEESFVNKLGVTFNDNGELLINCSVRMGKTDIKKQITVLLK